MAIRKPLPRLLCYDIGDPKRLGRVHRIVLEYAMPVQYSVYYLHADAVTVDRLCRELGEVIDPREDDIRIYPLPEGARAEVLGRQGLPEGIHLTGVSLPDGLGCGEEREES